MNPRLNEIVAMIIMIISTVIVVMCFSFLMTSCQDSTNPIDMELRAELEAENYISGFLKSPSTAEFNDAYVWERGDSTYTVSGEVDSQNGFGAMIRVNYTVDVQFLPKKRVRFKNLEIID